MNDAIKHSTGTVMAIAGGTGGWTLARVNEYGSCLCWIVGIAAGLCTIHSWWKGRNK